MSKRGQNLKKEEGIQEELDIDEVGTNKDAKEACPVECIHIIENK